MITFCVSRRRRKMCCGHVRLCVCVCVCVSVCLSVRGRTPTLRPFLHAKWHLNPSSRLATTDMDRKLRAVPHLGKGTEAYLHAKFHLDPFNRLATIHQRQRQTGQTDNGLITYGRTVLQTVAQKQHSRRNLVCFCMLCVNFVHSQIVTGWAIILHICFTQNVGLKFNIKIQMPYFHNIHKYCGNRHLD